jgi:hypothetical protein
MSFVSSSGQIITYLSTPAVGGLMKSVESHGSWSLLFMMKVMMVLYFMRDTCKVVTTLVLVTLV